jgi:tetratricopeptide (TPR) repeat protein
MLGIGSLASGAGTLEGMRAKIADVEAVRYVFPDGISIYLASAGNDMIISPSKAAVASSLATLKGGQSILKDPTFAKSLERLGANVTFAAYAHPGRCVEIAKPFMSPSDLAEAQPVIDLMTDTVASVVMEHSNETFRFSTMVTGLPDVGPFVSKLITMEQQASGSQHVWQQFKALAINQQDREAALAVAEQLFEQLHDDARRLNNCAWALLTEEDKFGDDYVDVALKFSQRSNELTEHAHWAYVDTLALAFFKTGDADRAIELEKKALALCGDGPERKEVEAALQRFQSATEP